MIHLNYDGTQNNGVIFNTKYPNGAGYSGVALKPELSFSYDSMQYSEVSKSLDYVEIDGVKSVMTVEQTTEVKALAIAWVQELGQQGNPNPAQIQGAINAEALAYLASTDWYIVRLLETDIVVPAEITALRAEARLNIVVV